MNDKQENEKPAAPEIKEEEPITTSHQLALADAALSYKATVGKMPLKDEKDKIVAQIFYTAYTLDSDESAARPLIFVFNGGPGSASIWLHMGAPGTQTRRHGRRRLHAAAALSTHRQRPHLARPG